MLYYHSKPGLFENGSRVTVAGEYADGMLFLSAARCSRKDQFRRKIGRLIAGGRLNKGQFFQVYELEEGQKADHKTFIDAATKAAEFCAVFPEQLSNAKRVEHLMNILENVVQEDLDTEIKNSIPHQRPLDVSDF